MADNTINLSGSTLIAVQPQTRRVENLHDETRDFDNSGSDSSSIEKLRISHTSAFGLELQTEHIKTAKGTLGTRVIGLANAVAQLEMSLRDRYKFALESTRTLEQVSEISIPERTHIRITLHWKRTWEDGVAILGQKTQPVAQIPYSVTVDLHYSKTTINA